MNPKYYFYKKKEEYSSEFNLQKRIPEVIMYLSGIVGFVLLALIILKIAIIIIYNENKPLSWWFFCGVSLFTVFVFLLLGYLASIHVKKFKKLADIFVNNEGINLPFPYDKNFQHTFLRFSDIKKVTVVNYPSTPPISKIIIFFNEKIKSPLGIMTDRYELYMRKEDVKKFINAIKFTTKDNIPIEYKSDIYY